MKTRFSTYLARVISVGCLATAAFLIANNHRAKTIAASALAAEEFVDCTCGSVADGNFDEYRTVSTGNSFGGTLYTLGTPGSPELPTGLGITQACQLKFFYLPPSTSTDPNVPVYLIATVRNNVAANSKVVRIPAFPPIFGTVPSCSQKPENYGCPDPAQSPCSCTGLFYRAQVAFISAAQPFGPTAVPSGPPVEKGFVLSAKDVIELQKLIDLYGANNIVIGGALNAPGSSSWRFRATNNSSATLNADVSITNPSGCAAPGSVITVTTTIANPGASAQPGTFSSLLPAKLLALPGTCTANVGTCTVVNSSTISYTGALGPNQTATVTYQAQVADGTPPNTQLCVSTQASVPNNCRVVTTCTTVNCSNGGTPGAAFPATSEVSDQKAGSVLFYNLYTSSATSPNSQNTRITLTNTDAARAATVHLFFVDGATCSVADSYICLTPNQTASFLASDIDPGVTGYILAVASDSAGCPINFNALIGDEYVKFATGHAANLGAESFAAIAGGLPSCNANSTTAALAFDGVSYNQAPRVLAADNIAARADGNDTLLALNRVGGNLATGAATLTNLFGLLFNDAETPVSFTFSPGACQFRSSLSNTFPRTAPRFDTVITSGRTGWIKVWSANDQGLLGAAININTNAAAAAGAFNQGHNLHKLRLTPSMVYTIPVFPPAC